MKRIGIAPIGLLVLSLLVLAPMAGPSPPTAEDVDNGAGSGSNGAHPNQSVGPTPIPSESGPSDERRGSEAPESDRLGWENGYWHDDPIVVDPTDGLNESELDAVVSRGMARLEVIRGWEFEVRPSVEIISRSEHRHRTADRSRNVSTADRLHQNVKFESLFMVGENEDAIATRRSNTGSNVLGYYTPESGDIVIVSENQTAPRLDEITLAQELFHAAQDRRHNISSYNTSTEERNNAVNGIIEGDGNYVDYLYQRRCRTDWTCLRPTRGSGGGRSSIHLGLFALGFQPYSDGPAFVRGIRERSGWAGVDEVYDDPPASTEQTIHPEKYGSDPPQPVHIENRSSGPWRVLQLENGLNYAEFGEAGIFSMFLYPGWKAGDPPEVIPTEPFRDPDASLDPYNYSHPYSAGWDGDKLLPIVTRDSAETNETGYVWKTIWDAPADAKQFHTGYEKLLQVHDGEQVRPGVWLIGTGPYADAFRIVRRDDTVIITNAPSTEALQQVRKPIGRPSSADEQSPPVSDGQQTGTESADSHVASGRTVSGRAPIGPVPVLVALALLFRQLQRSN